MGSPSAVNPLAGVLERITSAYSRHGGELLAALSTVLDGLDRQPAAEAASSGSALELRRTVFEAIAAALAYPISVDPSLDAPTALRNALSPMQEHFMAWEAPTLEPVFKPFGEDGNGGQGNNPGPGNLLGSYLIHGLLGRGTRADVYLARNRYSVLEHKRVVLKVLRNTHNFQDHVELFGTTDAAAPQVVRLLDLCQDRGYVFYVAERIKGDTLKALFSGFTPQKRLGMIPAVLRAIGDALSSPHVSLAAQKILVDSSGLRPQLSLYAEDGIKELRDLLEYLLKPFAKNASPHVQEIAAWMFQLLRECGGGVKPDHARQFIRFHTEPENADHIQLTAYPAEDGISYHVRRNGQLRPQILRAPSAKPDLVEQISHYWQQIGELARLKSLSRDAEERAALNRQIEDALRIIRGSTRLILPAELIDILARAGLCTVTFVHEPALNGVPWEALQIEAEDICIRFPLTRVPLIATPPKTREPGAGVLKIVIIYDSQLDGCKAEAERLEAVFNQQSERNIEVKVLQTLERGVELRYHIGDCDVCHFAVHGIRVNPGCDYSASGPHFHGGDALHADELAGMWHLRAPRLVFANACYVGAMDIGAARQRLPDFCIGFAQQVLAAGAANFIGAAHPISDSECTVRFAELFYEHWLSGRVISQAVQEARVAVRKQHKDALACLQHALLGDPFTTWPGIARELRMPLAEGG